MAMSAADKQKLLEKMRSKQKEQGGHRDATEWRPEKIKAPAKGEPAVIKEYKCFILPPLKKGDQCATGIAENDMNDLWYVQHGHHFVNNKKYECPRVHAEQGYCPVCDQGFDLMREVEDKKIRSELAKEWLSRQGWAVNLYFEDVKQNPDELRGKVLWLSIAKCIHDAGAKVLDAKDAGEDPERPKAFGMFCDPDAAFPLLISVTEKNDYNNYEASQFLGRSRPIADSEAKIQEILAKRHDLHTKFKPRDEGQLHQLLADKTGKALAGTATTESKPAATQVSKPAPAQVQQQAKAADPAPKQEVKTETKAAPAKVDAAAASDSEDEELKKLMAQLNATEG